MKKIYIHMSPAVSSSARAIKAKFIDFLGALYRDENHSKAREQ
jgi:hypothetical protein